MIEMKMLSLTHKLDAILRFLKQNRVHFDTLTKHEYNKTLSGMNTHKEKTTAILHYAVYTQFQPNINSLFNFFKQLNTRGEFDTFKSFVNSLDKINNKKVWTKNQCSDISYKGLFYRLSNKEGWGEKTAALFIKAIYNLHNENDFSLGYWHDLDFGLKNDDELYLPVDAVILKIFNKIDPTNNWNFKTINNCLKTYQKEDIIVWDDLWFWGFITQKTYQNDRIIEFNEAKLWSLISIPKDEITLNDIERKSIEFIKIINN